LFSDVIGIMIDVGREREINDQDGTPTKVNVIEIEQDGYDTITLDQILFETEHNLYYTL
jgi:hypothetical protein